MKKYDINKFDIFTDDEKWVKTNSVFDGFNNIFPQGMDIQVIKQKELTLR